MPEKKRYKNPPIVNRVVAFYHKMPQEEFEKKLPSWIEKINQDYPIPENVAEWTIDIEQKNGVPFVKNLMPKARIIRIFWKKRPENRHVIGMRLRADRIVFDLCRENDNSHDFEELIPEIEKWLPLWMEHFGIDKIEGTNVEYYNELNGLITPQLVKQSGVEIANSLAVFGRIPGRHVGVTDPYDCNVRLVMNDERNLLFDLRVVGDEKGTVHVDFIVRTLKNLSIGDAIRSVYVGHDLILEQFDCIFTEYAKESFKLI